MEEKLENSRGDEMRNLLGGRVSVAGSFFSFFLCRTNTRLLTLFPADFLLSFLFCVPQSLTALFSLISKDNLLIAIPFPIPDSSARKVGRRTGKWVTQVKVPYPLSDNKKIEEERRQNQAKAGRGKEEFFLIRKKNYCTIPFFPALSLFSSVSQ